jgi:hypothetical protein
VQSAIDDRQNYIKYESGLHIQWHHGSESLPVRKNLGAEEQPRYRSARIDALNEYMPT